MQRVSFIGLVCVDVTDVARMFSGGARKIGSPGTGLRPAHAPARRGAGLS
jgi:hypothetical protein